MRAVILDGDAMRLNTLKRSAIWGLPLLVVVPFVGGGESNSGSVTFLQASKTDPSRVQADMVAVMHNVGSNAMPLCFSVQLQDDKGKIVSTWVSDGTAASTDKVCPAQGLQAAEFHPYPLQVSVQKTKEDLRPLTGLLIVEINGPSKTTISKPLRLVPPSALGAEAPKPSDIVFAETSQTTVLLQPSAVSGTVQSGLVAGIQNKGYGSARVCFSLQLQDDKGKPTPVLVSERSGPFSEKICSSREIKPAEFYSYPLVVSADDQMRPLSGYLIAEVTQDATFKSSISKSIRLVPPMRPALSLYMFGLPLGVAALCILVAAFLVRRNVTSRMGSVTWDFSQSWATNITVAGTALTTLLSFTGLPEYGKFMAKSSYLSLALLFGILVTLAPSVYNFIRKPVDPPPPDLANPTKAIGPVFQGYVFGFLLASFLTLWGVLGQLTTIGLLLWEFADSGPLTPSMALVFDSVVVLIALFLLIYSDVTIYYNVKHQITHRDANRQRLMYLVTTNLRATPEDKTAAQNANQPLPTWSLL